MRKSFLPSASQPWGADIERLLQQIEKRLGTLESSTSGTRDSLAQVMPTIGRVNVVAETASDAAGNAQTAIAAADDAATTADDAVTWSPVDPRNPPGTDEDPVYPPSHPDALWYTVDGAGSVLRTWQWVPSNMDPDDENYVAGSWEQQKFGSDTIAPGAVSEEQISDAVNNTINNAKELAKQAAIDASSAVVLRVDSTRGLAFKNNLISTVLTVTVFGKGRTITDIIDLHDAFGPGAYLEWSWRRIDDTDFGIISSADSRLSDGGFKLTVSPEDVDIKTVFMCSLNV